MRAKLCFVPRHAWPAAGKQQKMPQNMRSRVLLRLTCSLVPAAQCIESSRLVSYRSLGAFYHHSANLQRYFTNRYHKKVCPSCSRPNILPSIACSYCHHKLTDADIRSVGRDSLRDLVLLRYTNHDQSKELQSRVELLGRRGAQDASSSLEDLLCGLPRRLAVHGHTAGQSRWCVELFRSFDFVVATYPFPASIVHLASIPKTSMYDVRQLRRSHIPLLKSMENKLDTLASLLVDLVVPISLERPPNAHRRKLLSTCGIGAGSSQEANNPGEGPESSLSVAEIRQQLRSMVVFGINYPSEYCQLCLHAIIPPIGNFGIFEAPYFYPLSNVLSDLERCGSAQVVAPSAILSPDSFTMLQTAKERDSIARRLLRTAQVQPSRRALPG